MMQIPIWFFILAGCVSILLSIVILVTCICGYFRVEPSPPGDVDVVMVARGSDPPGMPPSFFRDCPSNDNHREVSLEGVKFSDGSDTGLPFEDEMRFKPKTPYSDRIVCLFAMEDPMRIYGKIVGCSHHMPKAITKCMKKIFPSRHTDNVIVRKPYFPLPIGDPLSM
ncbi:uncharacterized protein LOC144348381 [Saccoglossus kowalevskii]